MEMTTKGRSYVTARGWEDLSQILLLYEEEQMSVDESLVGQYLRNDRVVKEFTAYYDLYNKYKKDYRIEEILEGHPSERALARAKEAGFDERLSLLGMLLDRVQADMKNVMGQGAFLSDLLAPLKAVKARSEEGRVEQLLDLLDKQAEGRRKLLASLQTAGSLSEEDRRKHRLVIRFLEESRKELYTADVTDAPSAFTLLKERYQAQVEEMKRETERTKGELHVLFAFVEEAFEEGNEMLILVTELTVNSFSAQFIATFGSDDYQRHNKELMLSERSQDIQAQIAELKL